MGEAERDDNPVLKQPLLKGKKTISKGKGREDGDASASEVRAK